MSLLFAPTTTWPARMRSWIDRASLASFDDALPLRLTLLVLLLRPPGDGLVHGATWLVAGSALALPRLAASAWVWLLLAWLIAARIVLAFPLADNHIYLLGYWCLGVGLTFAASRAPAMRRALLRDVSRWLVAGAFVCAVLWKGLLAPEFLDGRFFRVTLLTDERFATLARVIGGLDTQQLADARDALRPLPSDVEVWSGPVVSEPPALRRLARILTWSAMAQESLIALTFLAAWPSWIGRARHASLLLFCVTTYAVAPVAGFGWLLVILGMAHGADNERTQRALRLVYAAVFALILLYAETPAIPWLLEGVAAVRAEIVGTAGRGDRLCSGPGRVARGLHVH